MDKLLLSFFHAIEAQGFGRLDMGQVALQYINRVQWLLSKVCRKAKSTDKALIGFLSFVEPPYTGRHVRW